MHRKQTSKTENSLITKNIGIVTISMALYVTMQKVCEKHQVQIILIVFQQRAANSKYSNISILSDIYLIEGNVDYSSFKTTLIPSINSDRLSHSKYSQ